MDTLLFGYCLLLLITSSYLYLKIQKNFWTIGNFFLLQIIIFYIFVPINIIIFGGEIYEFDLKTYLTPYSKYVSFSSFFITVSFLSSFIVGSACRGSALRSIKIYIFKFNEIALYKISAYFLSLLSAFSLVIYVQQFGGFTSFADNLIRERSGRLAEDLVGNYAFVGRFIELAIIPIVYFLYEKHKKKIDWFLLLALPLSVIVFSNLFISVSKTRFFILILLFYFIVSISRNKIYLLYLFLLALFVAFALPILDEIYVLAYKVLDSEGMLAVPFRIAAAIISGSLGHGQYEEFLKEDSGNSYLRFVDYLISSQVSLQVSIDRSYPLLFFGDFYTGLSDIIPSRLNISTGLEAHQLNTALYYDYYPNLPSFSWGVPPGIIGFGMYSLSVPGVVLVAFILGYLFREVDLFFKSILRIDRKFSAFYAYIIFVLGFYSVSGMPKMVVYNLVILVFLLLFFVNFKFEILNNENE